MAFDFFKRSKSEPKSEPLKETFGEEMTAEEKAYLEEIEKRAKPDYDFDNPEKVEAELRRKERERLEKNYRPHNPLYHTSFYNNRSGEPAAVKGKSEQSADHSQQKSYQNDPRYRDYFERLKREGVQQPPSSSTKYDEEVKPVSLDELEQTAWSSKSAAQKNGRPVPPSSSSSASSSSANIPPRNIPRQPAPPSTASSSAYQSRQPASASASASPRSTDDLQAGALMRFDDGSVAIYKDAVSGKDYALFYFLEPTGKLEPRGIFLEQYEQQKIGQVSATLLAQMIERKRWERDAVVFHLDQFEYSSFIPHVTGGSTAGSGASATSSTTGNAYRSRAHSTTGANNTPSERRPATDATGSSYRSANGSTSGSATSSGVFRRDALLERGRVLRINVGGKVWESVYWTEDEIGPIVAHNTNRDWALMHLDLNRFKDSLEYGDVVSYEQLSEIEQSLASQGK